MAIMILGILQARTSSSRLPRKVLQPILGLPMLLRQVERLRRCVLLDELVVATSVDPSDDELVELCTQNGIRWARGSLDDVLQRTVEAAAPYRPNAVVRLTGDCPLADWEIIDAAIERFVEGKYDYVSNAHPPTWPDGLDVEVITFAALLEANRHASTSMEREHVTPYIHNRPGRFRVANLEGETDFSHLRWTVDEPVDLDRIRRIYDRLYAANPAFRTPHILELFESEPELSAMGADIARNSGLYTSRYRVSQKMLERALEIIPGGTQTFSKSFTQYPRGVSPHFIERGAGARVWDADGNEYSDFVNALLAVTLGYRDPDVDLAVRRQLELGVTFTLPHRLEYEVAERIIDVVPCAEQVRFGKNGTDVTSAAVRIARAATGRERVAVCGYHGWQDWYIGATSRNLGVPEAVQALTHTFQYNDPASLQRLLESYPGEFAAVILEPMNATPPEPGFLQSVKRLTHAAGAVLVFDEIVTGFRFDVGGAQALFSVTPDLATFGKGVANGFPLSVLTGRAELMQLMDRIFYSGTFAGETLSLAAARAVLDKMGREPVIERIAATGERVRTGIESLIATYECNGFASVTGHPSWTFLRLDIEEPKLLWDMKSLLLQEMFAHGVLMLGTHNISFAHEESDVERLFQAYDRALPLLRQAYESGDASAHLRGEPLRPLFRLR